MHEAVADAAEGVLLEPRVRAPRSVRARRWLVATDVCVLVLLVSMALPWFTSSETPSWTPFAHWLDLGWAPGTRNWGLLVLGLGIVVAVATAVVAVRPGRTGLVLVLVAATALLAVTMLEATAGLSVDPGPDLHADWGAVLGVAALLAGYGCLWCGVSVELAG